MNHRERMLAGLPYQAWKDGLDVARLENKKKIFAFNNMPPQGWEPVTAALKEILGKTGEDVYIEAPFHCDYGFNIEVGEHFYANYNLVILDICKVTIGEYAMIGPNVAIYAAGHPIHPQARNSGYEYGAPVTIGDNVWIGGNTVILPEVTIGNNVVIGAGSVVGHDLPDNVVAVGNPCRVVREIEEEERHYYRRGCPFDVDDYLTPMGDL